MSGTKKPCGWLSPHRHAHEQNRKPIFNLRTAYKSIKSLHKSIQIMVAIVAVVAMVAAVVVAMVAMVAATAAVATVACHKQKCNLQYPGGICHRNKKYRKLACLYRIGNISLR